MVCLQRLAVESFHQHVLFQPVGLDFLIKAIKVTPGLASPNLSPLIRVPSGNIQSTLSFFSISSERLIAFLSGVPLLTGKLPICLRIKPNHFFSNNSVLAIK